MEMKPFVGVVGFGQNGVVSVGVRGVDGEAVCFMSSVYICLVCVSCDYSPVTTLSTSPQDSTSSLNRWIAFLFRISATPT